MTTAELVTLPRETDADNPALGYIASLTRRLSQVTMASTLVLVAATIKGLDPATIPNVGSQWPMARDLLREFPWAAMREEHVVLLRNRLRAPDPRRPRATAGYSDVFLNKVLVALRQVARRAKQRHLMPVEACDEILGIRRIRVKRVPAGRLLTVEELTAILAAARNQATHVAARDLAIMSILMGTGCRRDEVASLRLSAYDAKLGILRLAGKGNKQREVPVNQFLRRSIDAWVELRGSHPGALFHRISRKDEIDVDSALGSSAVFYVIRKLATDAGIARGDRLPSPHDFRRTFITLLLDKGVDLLRVAKIVGHESVETTRIYDYRGIEEQRAATAVMDGILSGA